MGTKVTKLNKVRGADREVTVSTRDLLIQMFEDVYNVYNVLNICPALVLSASEPWRKAAKKAWAPVHWFVDMPSLIHSHHFCNSVRNRTATA